ncbi:MAG: hypothetical protein ACQET8_23030 [Bacillota bacterium]
MKTEIAVLRQQNKDLLNANVKLLKEVEKLELKLMIEKRKGN